jgi:hypothetical protein
LNRSSPEVYNNIVILETNNTTKAEARVVFNLPHDHLTYGWLD